MFVIVSQREQFISAWRGVLVTFEPAAEIDVLTAADDVVVAMQDPHRRLLVVDLDGMRGDRATVLKAWKHAVPSVPVILGGAIFPSERELAALSLGMSACCDERLSVANLSRIVNVVLGGGVWVSGSTLPQLMNRLARLDSEKQIASAPDDSTVDPVEAHWNALTERQRAVAVLIAEGESNKLIARRLNIADRTVKAHLSAVFEKLGVSDRMQLAVLLNRHKHVIERATLSSVDHSLAVNEPFPVLKDES